MDKELTGTLTVTFTEVFGIMTKKREKEIYECRQETNITESGTGERNTDLVSINLATETTMKGNSFKACGSDKGNTCGLIIVTTKVNGKVIK